MASFLSKRIGQSEAEELDKKLDALDAISIAFLMSSIHDITTAVKICHALELSWKNEVPPELCEVKAAAGVVFWSWYKNRDAMWEEKICEALFLTNNYRLLNDLGLKLEDARERFRRTYLEPIRRDLFLVCREMLEDQRREMTLALGLYNRYRTVEAQILIFCKRDNCSLEQFVHQCKLRLPPRIVDLFVPSQVEKHTDSIHSGVGGEEIEEEYPRGKGHVVIINQKNFYCDPNNPRSMKLESRYGTDIDRDRLEKAFTYLGGTVRTYNNQTNEEMERILLLETKYINENASKFAWLAVCVLTHGARSLSGKDEVYSCDGVPMDRRKIIKMFNEHQNIPNFRDKPRIFVFQACRGVEQNSSLEQGIKQVDESLVEEEEDIYARVPEGDYLVCNATVENHLTYRSIERGSFYISQLCEVLVTDGHVKDILSILTTVNAMMKIYDNRYPSRSAFDSKLTKKFYFERSMESFAQAVEMHIQDEVFRKLLNSVLESLPALKCSNSADNLMPPANSSDA